jgi:hypothetical protein
MRSYQKGMVEEVVGERGGGGGVGVGRGARKESFCILIFQD